MSLGNGILTSFAKVGVMGLTIKMVLLKNAIPVPLQSWSTRVAKIFDDEENQTNHDPAKYDGSTELE